MAAPRVFEEGAMTIVVAQHTGMMSIYVGSVQIGLVESLTLRASKDVSVPEVSVSFPERTGDSGVDLKVEENVRMVSNLPWVSVERRSSGA